MSDFVPKQQSIKISQPIIVEELKDAGSNKSRQPIANNSNKSSSFMEDSD
jgi:hypothetical protein